jgi:hypothetical protein
MVWRGAGGQLIFARRVRGVPATKFLTRAVLAVTGKVVRLRRRL